MRVNLSIASLPALALLLALSAAPASFAEDAMAPAPTGTMAPATDAMAPDAMAPDAMAPGAMAPMTDEELKACLEKAGSDAAATQACHDMHNGMAPGGAMAPDAMAPAADAMAPAGTMAPATK